MVSFVDTVVSPNPARFSREGRTLPAVATQQGAAVVTFKDLLNLAHENGLSSLYTRIVHFPTKDEPYAVCEATATFTDGTSFSEIGDATPDNVTKFVAKHYIRMSATRAKGRALRDALNIEAVTAEELDEAPSGGGSTRGRSTAPKGASTGPKATEPGDTTARGLTVPDYNNNTDDGWVCEISGEEIYDGGNFTAAERAAFSAAEFGGHIVGYKSKDTETALAWKSGKGGKAKPAATAASSGADDSSPW